MRNIIIFSLAMVIGAGVCGAGWERTYGGIADDYGLSIMQVFDGGFIISGYTSSFSLGDYDVYLIRTDAKGDTIWTRTYGGSSNDYGYSVTQTSDSGYIISGWTESFGVGWYDVYLVRTNSVGDTMWTRTYGGSDRDWGHSVAQTSDGGYIIAGWTHSFGLGEDDVYLIKTDADGDTIWTRTYGGSACDRGKSVEQTSDGGYIVVGYTESFGIGSSDVYLIKINPEGDILWTCTYGGSDSDWGRSVAQISDGGYIIAGRTYSFGAGEDDVYLIRTDADGDTIWTHTYGGSIYDHGRSVAQISDGGYIITGRTYSFGAGEWDVYLIRTDADGDSIWTCTYGGSGRDEGRSVDQTSDGGYIITGGTSSFGSGSYDVYIVKIDSDDILEWESTIPLTLSLSAFPNPFNSSCAITVSENANVEVFDLRGKRICTHNVGARHSLQHAQPDKKLSGNASPLQDGMHTFIWRPDETIASGIYLVRARAEDGQMAEKKIVLVR